ncbi:MAG TPA: VTT domain-containing protein [Acidobacteriaceae bacterium]|nr:VTT domain-containing protein [Acidobacteriaceae bacterium]
MPLGPWGVLLGSFIDSASIPIPIDVLMGLWAWSDKKHFYVYALLAALGSTLGGLVPFFLGRAGGELFLLKRIDRARFESLRNQFEKQEFLAVMVPSLLPPPTTWKLFVFGAGVFEMRTWNFMLAVFIGRTIRFGVETALVVKYGPQIVTVVADLAKKHLILTLAVLALIFGALGWYVWRKLRRRSPGASSESGQATA